MDNIKILEDHPILYCLFPLLLFFVFNLVGLIVGYLIGFFLTKDDAKGRKILNRFSMVLAIIAIIWSISIFYLYSSGVFQPL
jgi:hypothetical protein